MEQKNNNNNITTLNTTTLDTRILDKADLVAQDQIMQTRNNTKSVNFGKFGCRTRGQVTSDICVMFHKFVLIIHGILFVYQRCWRTWIET